MKDQIKIIIATVLVFLTGLATGLWIQRNNNQLPPPPPFGPMAEFERGQHEGPGAMPPEQMEQMRSRMEQMKPKMEEFQKKLEAIEEKSRAELAGILNDEQKAKFEKIIEHRDRLIEKVGKEKKDKKGKDVIKDERPPEPRVKRFEFMATIIYKPLQERISEDLGLNDDQKKSLEKILLQRRVDVLALIDSNPPPSIEMWDHSHGDKRGPKDGPMEGPQGGPGPMHGPGDDHHRGPQDGQCPQPPPQDR